MLNSKQRAYLRGLANSIQPIYQVGKGGVSETMLEQLSLTLEARKLIKITVLETCEFSAREVADGMESALNCDVISVVGRKVVLYRRSEKKQTIFLPT